MLKECKVYLVLLAGHDDLLSHLHRTRRAGFEREYTTMRVPNDRLYGTEDFAAYQSDYAGKVRQLA